MVLTAASLDRVQECRGLARTATYVFGLAVIPPPHVRSLARDPNDGPLRTHDPKWTARRVCRRLKSAGGNDGFNGRKEQRSSYLQAPMA